jgi:hypothetical protein
VCEFITVNTPELLKGMFDNIGGSIKLPPEKGARLPAPPQGLHHHPLQ